MDKLATDVLVIGAGAAGIRAAIEASMAGVEVTLVADAKPAKGGSTFSGISRGWGIQALTGEERTAANLEAFYDDVMRVGLGCCDPRLVRILVEESGARIQDLMSYGLEFKTGANGEPIRARGCFSEIERAFLTRDIANIRGTFLSILQRVPVRIVTGYAIDLIVNDGQCLGAWIGLKRGGYLQINAKSTILATGGGSGIFKDHMSNEGGCGAGYALAHRAGARITNMEFIQFALGLKNNRTRKFLPIGQLDQAGKIVNTAGCDILNRYVPDDKQRRLAIEKRQNHMPFSCRDSSGQVDIAIAQARRSDKHLYWHDGGPKEDRFEVVHFAHAFNGGIKINEEAESTVAGLYAAGEVAAGTHGADRIGGCMMTATQVFGKRAGHFAARRATQVGTDAFPPNAAKLIKSEQPADRNEDVMEALAVIEDRVKETMAQYAGVLRTKKGLKKARSILDTCQTQLDALGFIGADASCEYYRVRSMAVTAHLVVQSALIRGKSMGSHYRQDDKNYQANN